MPLLTSAPMDRHAPPVPSLTVPLTWVRPPHPTASLGPFDCFVPPRSEQEQKPEKAPKQAPPLIPARHIPYNTHLQPATHSFLGPLPLPRDPGPARSVSLSLPGSAPVGSTCLSSDTHCFRTVPSIHARDDDGRFKQTPRPDFWGSSFCCCFSCFLRMPDLKTLTIWLSVLVVLPLVLCCWVLVRL
jgi:hypothetical protein